MSKTKKPIRILNTAALVAGLAVALPATATAAGQLGERYLSATFNWVDIDEAGLRNGKGSILEFNQPVSERFDMTASYSYLYTRLRTTRAKLDGHELFLDGTYLFSQEGIKPYARAGIGWARAGGAGLRTSDWLYGAETGLEIPGGEKVSVTPHLRWVDGFRGRVDGTLEVGVRGEVALGEKTSLIGRVARDDDKDWTASVGMLFRF